MQNNQPEFKTKEEILSTSLSARENEVMFYEININNYKLAIEEIEKLSGSDREEMASFETQLRSLLASEITEHKKSIIMLNVLKRQVGD